MKDLFEHRALHYLGFLLSLVGAVGYVFWVWPGPAVASAVGAVMRGGLFFAAGLGFVLYVALRSPRSKDADAIEGLEQRGPDPTKHSYWSGGLHLGITQAAAIGMAWHFYDGDGGEAFGHYSLMSMFVGSTIALFRSTRTNSTTLATQRSVAELVGLVRQIRRDRADKALVLQRALSLAEAKGLEAYLAGLQALVNEAIALPETHDHVDALSLWIRWEGEWTILSGSSSLSPDTLDSFRQPILDAPKPGAGLVANLAVSGERMIILPEDAETHEWFAPDGCSSRSTVGFAAAILLNGRGETVGAICLTAQSAGAIPPQSLPLARTQFEEVLITWAAAFTLAVSRYESLVEAERS